ncbi:hypothetical protein ACFRH6_11130 [Streptomyces sp. NPDC056749]
MAAADVLAHHALRAVPVLRPDEVEHVVVFVVGLAEPNQLA